MGGGQSAAQPARRGEGAAGAGRTQLDEEYFYFLKTHLGEEYVGGVHIGLLLELAGGSHVQRLVPAEAGPAAGRLLRPAGSTAMHRPAGCALAQTEAQGRAVAAAGGRPRQPSERHSLVHKPARQRPVALEGVLQRKAAQPAQRR